MAKKRKCRYTAEELAIHEEAVRLRKMTDRQLVTEFHRAAEQETSLNVPDANQRKAYKRLKPLSDTSPWGLKGVCEKLLKSWAKAIL